MEICLVTAENAHWLDHVASGVFDHNVDQKYLSEYMENPSNLLLVAREDETVIGMATGIVYVHPDKPRQLFINEVGVDDAWQGKGIGKALVQALCQAGRNLGAHEAWVATEVDNEPARALYRSTGGVQDPSPIVMYVYDLG